MSWAAAHSKNMVFILREESTFYLVLVIFGFGYRLTGGRGGGFDPAHPHLHIGLNDCLLLIARISGVPTKPAPTIQGKGRENNNRTLTPIDRSASRIPQVTYLFFPPQFLPVSIQSAPDHFVCGG